MPVRHTASDCAHQVLHDRRAAWRLLHDLASEISAARFRPDDRGWEEVWGEVEYLVGLMRDTARRPFTRHGIEIDLDGYWARRRERWIEPDTKPEP